MQKVVHELIHLAKKLSTTVDGGISLMTDVCQGLTTVKLAQILFQNLVTSLPNTGFNFFFFTGVDLFKGILKKVN